ncbi:uncharacterized protein LOC108251982 isoform X2 [Diaphorina citri]|uniref:Uncharacterized protein LOC108251982 isoform X2 n=1 Tax=Diaphorina citri TaxID=121845 RepID=A0A1S4E7G6_DIACI|nr:uncharacterized protein LOC108251982 isoform X2 [Diaphorina citri]
MDFFFADNYSSYHYNKLYHTDGAHVGIVDQKMLIEILGSVLDKVTKIDLNHKELVEKIQALQESVNSLVRKQVNYVTATESNELKDLLTHLPLKSYEEISDRKKLITEESTKNALVNYLKIVAGTKLDNFVRNVLRTLFRDEAIVHFCWTGVGQKHNFSNLRITAILSEAIEKSKFQINNRNSYIRIIKDHLGQATNRINGRTKSRLLKRMLEENE